MIAPYTIIDYKNCGAIQCEAHYVTINEKLLVLGFEPFHSRYILLRLLTMTVVKCLLVNTEKSDQNITTTVNGKTVVKWVLPKVYFVVMTSKNNEYPL